MEVEEIQTQGCKFPRIGNGTSRGSDYNKLGQNGEEKYQDDEEDGVEIKRNGSGGSPFGGSGRVYGWPSSRIVRVSRASGGKDRHSKVWTSQGLRDRRIRLSVSTAIQFYDLQDRLGLDQPSKAVEWLLKAAAKSIDELRSIDTSFPDTLTQLSDEKRSSTAGNNDHQGLESAELELDCDPKYQQQKQHNSSASETSKGSSLSLSSRSENRIKARERARERKAEREKEKGGSNVNPIAQSSFTELLTGGINNVNSNNNSSGGSPNGSAQQNHSGSGEANLFQKSRHWSSSSVPMDYFAHHHSSGFSQQIHLGNSLPVQSMTISPFSVGGDQHFSFDPGNLIPVAASTASGGGGDYNLNFSISSGLAGLNRGTLQSNSPSMLSHLQRLSPIDGPNVPFFIGTAAPNAAPVENHHHHHNHHNHNHQFPAGFDGCLQLHYGDGGRNADQKGKGKN